MHLPGERSAGLRPLRPAFPERVLVKFVAPVSAAFAAQPTMTAALVVLGTLGLAVRLRQYLGRPSYWYDEAWFLLFIIDRSWLDLVALPSEFRVHPPAFAWSLRALYVLAGSSEPVMRLPAQMSSLLSVVVMIPLARRYVGSPCWPWTVALCAVSHHGLTHAYEVKPYASDFLVTQLILLSAYPLVKPLENGAPTGRPPATLFALALLAPWWSFPSLFVLGATSLALLLQVLKGRSRWTPWLLFNGMALSSALLLWLLMFRTGEYSALQRHFAACFPGSSSVVTGMLWLLRRLVSIGDYGTTAMGVPLLLLAGLGTTTLWRHSTASAVLLGGPVALAVVAAAMHRYPFCDRLAFFAVPCVWLPATAGIAVLASRLRARGAWLVAVLLAVLLLPGAARMAGDLVRPQPRSAFRDAFDYVRTRWVPGDQLWVVNPEVFAVYFGRSAPVLSPATPPSVVEQAAQQGRLWLIDYPPGAGRSSIHSIYGGLPDEAVEYRTVKGLEIFLFASNSAPR